MKFLSINTSTSLCSVSLFENNNFETLEKNNVKDHTVYLGDYTQKLLNGNIKDLDFFVVSVGPGSYAGIRTGVSFCKGLSLAVNKPIIPVNNFDCMQDSLNILNKYYLAIHSHKDFVYSQMYESGKKISDSRCIKIENLKDYPLYGYNLEVILNNKDFTKIDLTSKVIGEFAIKNYKQLLEKDINRVNPIYIEM